MTPELAVTAHEAGIVRLFAIDPAAPALAAILPPHPLDAGHLAPLLGLASLREDGAERIAIADLGDYTLSEFLRIGHDLRSADLAPVAARLDSQTGQILLLHSTAFAGQAAQITPATGLRFLGAFHRNDAPAAPLSLPAHERPEILEPHPDDDSPAPRRRHLWVKLILAVMLAIVIVERLMS